jgi:quinol monooxygenase YgiN
MQLMSNLRAHIIHESNRKEKVMIVVLGSVIVQDGKVDEAIAVSQEHVRRSRTEPGCIEHGVSVDTENARRLVFVERWVSMEALKAHFAVPGSRNFFTEISALASTPPSMSMFDATAITLAG